jgi:hypothetical protein
MNAATPGKLNLELTDLLIAPNAEALIFIAKMMGNKDLIEGEEEEGIGTLDGNIMKTRINTVFLFLSTVRTKNTRICNSAILWRILSLLWK